MAIKDNLGASSLYNFEQSLSNSGGAKQYQPWEGYSGDDVEDYITRRLANSTITGMEYAGTILTLTKEDGSTISAEVTPVPPTYNYGIKIVGFKVDGQTYTQGNIVLSSTSDVKLLVGAYGTIQLTGDPKDKGGQVNVTISYGSGSNKLSLSSKLGLLSKDSFEFDANGDIVKLKDGVAPIELDVNDLFKTYQKDGSLSIKLIPASAEGVDPIETSLANLNITCEVPVLKYNLEQFTVNINEVTFNLSGGTSGQYILSGYNNGVDIGQVTSLTYANLTPGLNQLVVRAKHKDYNANKVISNWVTVDLIYTENCNSTVIAVNGVSGGIINNGVAELYHLTIYSPNKEELLLTTYLEDAMGLEQGSQENLIKQETIGSYSYDVNNTYKTNYKKYIEEDSSGHKYLMVCSNDTYYTFYTPNEITSTVFPSIYKSMTIEEPNVNFMYYKDSPRSYNYDQITGQATDVFSKNNINPNLEATDGWGEKDGICYFRVSAQPERVFIDNLDLRLQQSSGFSLEFGFKTYNISNKSKPILSLGKLQLWPTQLVWWDSSDSKGEESALFKSRNSQFQEGVDTHVMITVHPQYKISSSDPYKADFLQGNQESYEEAIKNFAFNLVRVYINGCIDRAFILNDAELAELVSSKLDINPTTSDVDLYLLRVYNTAGLSDDIVQKNYNSFIFNKKEKQLFYDHNDIVEEINGYKVISFNKARTKQNTIVLVLPKGVSFPNYTWDETMEKTAKKNPATMFINYADPVINTQYGGRITNGQIKGQGSSAKRYLIWNVQNQFGKYKDDGIDSIFISYSPSNFDSDINKFKSDAQTTQKNCYVMPPYTGQEDSSSKVKKSVGKINWASSMQSHKIGACKLYEDAFKATYPETKGLIGKKAVHEEPYLYFYWETDLDTVENVELADVLAAGTSVKFAGFQTWGAGKGDKYESGYGDDTPEYLMLEGGENANITVNFRCPWHALQTKSDDGEVNDNPVISKADSLENPEAGLFINDESIEYNGQGAWDIDFGCNDDGDGFVPEVKTSLKRFRDFYDFVYKHDFSFVVKSGSSCDSSSFTTVDGNGNEILDAEHKYLVTVPKGKFTINNQVVTNHVPGDVYRYDIIAKTWVPAGLFYENGQWTRYNIFEEFPDSSNNPNIALSVIKEKFKTGIVNYIDVNDIAFHQAFVKFVSGTDNRAKNTYFQIIGPKYEEVGDSYIKPERAEDDWSDYKIRLIGDDLDTIFVTDNSGLQSKPYNLLEASYDKSFSDHWGDAHNIFFYMFDLCFEKEIITNLKHIIDKAFDGKDISNKDSYFYQQFFKVQENYPVVAYNHTSRLYYENAYVIKEKKVIPGYENNLGVDPIGQIHGSCLPCEKQFMTERLNFLNGYAQTNLSNYYATADVGSTASHMNIKLEFTPYQDFYPNYGFGAAGGGGAIPNYVISTPNESCAVGSLAKKDVEQSVLIQTGASEIYQGLFQTHLYKKFNILGSRTTNLPSLERGTDLYIDNNDIVQGIQPFKLTDFSGAYPVLENLTLRNIELPSTLSLTNCYKLRSVDLSGSITSEVSLPISGQLHTLILPETIKKLEIYNNPGLTDLVLESYDNLETVYIDCGKCGTLNISEFCENLSPVSLKKITLKNMNNVYLTEETLNKLLNVDCVLEGSLTIVNSIGDTQPKDISFATKLKLVNKFGNIDSSNNKLFINYTTSNITKNDIIFPIEVSAYYNTQGTATQHFEGLFPLEVISGNNVKIIDGPNPFNPEVNGYLDISYTISGVTSTYAVIGQYTGTLTVYKEVPKTTTASVNITLTTINGVKLSNTDNKTKVSFAWQAPKLGDFAYADGSFSSYYNKHKTLVGLVYAKEGDEESGTVYIIGKEYSNPTAHYSGFTTKGIGDSSSDPNSNAFQIYKLSQYLDGTLHITSWPMPTTVSVTNVNSITKNSYENISEIGFYGKSDTLTYVNFVNGEVLPGVLQGKKYSDFFVTPTNDGGYNFTTITNLNNACKKLTTTTLDGATKYNSALLYPYFYSAYLYEPALQNESEILHDAYKQGNWYAPSVGELARIIYYRGYSASQQFDMVSYVTQEIQEDITNGNTENTTPIFSLAKSRGFIADVWNTVVGTGTSGSVNNVVTTKNNSGINYDRYSYQVWKDYNDSVQAQWVEGADASNSWSYTSQATNAWSYTPHQGIPFTEFTYQKPS